jgi:TolB-like protein
MVEEITTAIARLPWLFVIARNSAFTYKGRSVRYYGANPWTGLPRRRCRNTT